MTTNTQQNKLVRMPLRETEVLSIMGLTPDEAIECPVRGCGFSCLHILRDSHGRVDIKGVDTGITSVTQRMDEGTLRIPMWCENGHHFDLIVGEHKGSLYFWAEETVEVPQEELDASAAYDLLF